MRKGCEGGPRVTRRARLCRSRARDKAKSFGSQETEKRAVIGSLLEIQGRGRDVEGAAMGHAG